MTETVTNDKNEHKMRQTGLPAAGDKIYKNMCKTATFNKLNTVILYPKPSSVRLANFIILCGYSLR